MENQRIELFKQYKEERMAEKVLPSFDMIKYL